MGKEKDLSGHIIWYLRFCLDRNERVTNQHDFPHLRFVGKRESHADFSAARPARGDNHVILRKFGRERLVSVSMSVCSFVFLVI